MVGCTSTPLGGRRESSTRRNSTIEIIPQISVQRQTARLETRARRRRRLILTNLGRLGAPAIRYRTGDQVRLNRSPCDRGRTFARMGGGIIGRIDQMLIVRGANISPSAIEAIVRAYPEVQEFAVIIDRAQEMDELEIQIKSRARIKSLPTRSRVTRHIAWDCGWAFSRYPRIRCRALS